ncbi:radical SAM protein [Methanosarcinales archaeon]|nr:MAG: radical SAM protein [Methanosarcinales archaeon]
MENIKQFLMQQAIKNIISRTNSISDKNIRRIFDFLIWIKRDDQSAQEQISAVKQAVENNEPMGIMVKRIFREMHPNVRNKFIINLILNNSYGLNAKKREMFKNKEGFYPPFTILLSPSMRCNLRCKGCYASEYSQKDDLPYEIIERVIEEARQMGVYFFTILGGEPFICDYMQDIYEKFSDVAFQVFTNGTLLNEKTVERIIQLGNVMPIVSLEGSQKETDSRRGKGVYQKTMRALDNLHQAGALYGFSVMVTRDNTETICGDRFNQLMVKKGCYWGWHFLYMPVGRSPDVSLMPTPKQREFMRTHGAARIRKKFPIVVADFWNDAPYVGGCIAGGRNYLHINSNGDVEPCIFAHFAVDNVKEKSLREVLKSPFFKAMRARQPFNENLLLPCQLIDHPHIFREIFNEFHPYPTHPGAENLVTKFSSPLDEYSAKVKSIMDDAWEKDFVRQGFHYKGKEHGEKEGVNEGRKQKKFHSITTSTTLQG